MARRSEPSVRGFPHERHRGYHVTCLLRRRWTNALRPSLAFGKTMAQNVPFSAVREAIAPVAGAVMQQDR